MKVETDISKQENVFDGLSFPGVMELSSAKDSACTGLGPGACRSEMCTPQSSQRHKGAHKLCFEKVLLQTP